MSALADFYDLLLPELPGCTTGMVDLHLIAVVREFCSKTGAWREELTAIDLVANQAAYTVATTADSSMVKITSLTVNAELLWIDTDADVETQPTYARANPPFKMSGGLTQITLDEAPTAAVTGGLLIAASLKPTIAATTLPDFLKAQYSEAIRLGVLSRMMVMKKPWGDRALAMDYAAKWHAELNFAAYQAQVGNTRKPLRVKKHL